MAGSSGSLSRNGLRGREVELEELQALIASVARTGSGGLALIQGEPGIGKTTLLAETVTRARAAGFSVGLGKADELHHMVPLSSLAASSCTAISRCCPAMPLPTLRAIRISGSGWWSAWRRRSKPEPAACR